MADEMNTEPDCETWEQAFARLGIEIDTESKGSTIVFGGGGMANALIARGIGIVKHVTLDEPDPDPASAE